MTKLLKDLPVGAIVKDKDTVYKGKVIRWVIVDKNHRGYPVNSVSLMPYPRGAYFEGKETHPLNESSDGSGIEYKNLEFVKWICSRESNWSTNNQTTYKDEVGFLGNFSKDLYETILLTSIREGVFKVFLPSAKELNCVSGYRTVENYGYVLEYFKDKPAWGATSHNNIIVRNNPANRNDILHSCWNDNMGPFSLNTKNYIISVVLNAKDDIKIFDDRDSQGDYIIKFNQPPSKPESFTLPEKVISRYETEISWTNATDPENDPISYRLERSLDGGGFVERYKGSFTRYKDVIEDKGHKTVVYRVTAIDSNGHESESLTSASIHVSDDTIPIIETASADLGKITSVYSVDYKVADPDEGQTWKVTESLDGKVLKTFDAKVGTSYTSELSDSDWKKVLNGNHTLRIEVVDSEGVKSFKDISFEKAVTKLDFEMEKSSLEPLDKMPERAILSMGANIPAEASIKVEISNNALDDKPVWQDCTSQVLGNNKIFFSNKIKTATKWAVNIRVTADKKTATEVLSVSSIGGFYD